jgi:hypothetical protein
MPDLNTKLPAGTLNALWNDRKNWRAYGIYFCKADPRCIVPKRNKWAGWTMNFARPSGWIALLIAILYLMLPITFLCSVGLFYGWIGYSVIAWLLISVSAVCWVLSSPQRYEKQNG